MSADTTDIGAATPVQAPAQPAEAGPKPAEFSKVGPLASLKLGGEDVQANLSAVGTVSAESFSATGSAMGAASIDGDASITASIVPAVIARGRTTVQQSYVSAVIVSGGDQTNVHQAFAPLIVGKTVDITQGGAVATVAGSTNVKSSWVGIVLSPRTTVSEDSRVLVDTRAALIIAAALFGGLGLVALAITLGVRRIMRWRPQITLPSLPNLPDLSSLPSISDLNELRERFMHRHAA